MSGQQGTWASHVGPEQLPKRSDLRSTGWQCLPIRGQHRLKRIQWNRMLSPPRELLPVAGFCRTFVEK